MDKNDLYEKCFAIDVCGKEVQKNDMPETSCNSPELTLPAKMYYGCSLNSATLIQSQGILNDVYLYANMTEPFRIGDPYPVVFEIDSKAVIKGGGKIYSPESHYWLCSEVPATAIIKMYIGQLLAYFECQQQWTIAMDICNNHAVLAKVADFERRHPSYNDSELISANAERIADNITFETDFSSKCIFGFATIPVDSDVSYYEAATEYLYRLFRMLRSYFPVDFFDNMPPAIYLDDKNRIEQYIEMSVYFKSEVEMFMPIDLLSLGSMGRTAKRCRIFPVIENSSSDGLIKQIEDLIQEYKTNGAWLYLQMFIPDEKKITLGEKWTDEETELIMFLQNLTTICSILKARLFIIEK